MAYLILCAFSGMAGGVIGRIKGSSFFIWFLVSAVIPIVGPITALLFRVERDELRRQCPTCGKVGPLYDAICTRCGTELEFPETAIVPESQARQAR